MSVYNLHQQIFLLSVAANLGRSFKGTQGQLQRCMQRWLPFAIRSIGSWEVVWGPVVWKSQPNDVMSGSDESWYVAKNSAVTFEDGNEYTAYVVAVGGTSTSYAMMENILVNQVVDFASWIAKGVKEKPNPTPPHDVDPSHAYAAYGTVNIAHRLLTCFPSEGAHSAGISLCDFLACLPDSSPVSSKFIFAGHSRGGALAPTLALALVQAGVLPTHSVLTYPLGAPSPGNGRFADLFASTFPRKLAGSGYKVWNVHIFNTRDIVTHAWCTDKLKSPGQNLDNVPPIYGTPALHTVSAVIHGLKNHANDSNITYMPLQNLPFTGTPVLRTPLSEAEYLAIALEQHVAEYFKFFALSQMPFGPLHVLPDDGVISMTQEELYLTVPVVDTIAHAVLKKDSFERPEV